MATLEELRLGVFPLAAAPPGGKGGAATDREVAWVRVLKARVPAFDALDPGDLAILPEAALRALVAGGVEAGSIVEALARSGAAGALLVGEGSADVATKIALARADEIGLPAWRLAPGDAGEVERSVIGYLVNARAELERRAADLEGQLGAAALGGHDLSALAAIMAAFLGRAVAIEGPRGAAAAVHAPDTVPGAAAAAAHYLANRRQVVLRMPLPGGGAVVVLGDPPATELERVAASRVAALLALELGREVGAARVLAELPAAT